MLFYKQNHFIKTMRNEGKKVGRVFRTMKRSAPLADSDLIFSCKGEDGEEIESEHIR
jgi:hypothetical protein